MASRKSKRPQSSASPTRNADFHKLTVVQLRKKLSDHNILLEKSDKKAKLVELCIQHGLDLHVQQPVQTAAEQSVVEDNTIFTLTKTMSAKDDPAPHHGNFENTVYLKEESILHRIRDVCTLLVGA